MIEHELFFVETQPCIGQRVKYVRGKGKFKKAARQEIYVITRFDEYAVGAGRVYKLFGKKLDGY